MTKRMLIDAAHQDEMRVVILQNDRVQDYDFVTSSKAQVKGNIYLAKITRVEPSLQAAFVEYGGGKQGFLPFSEIHPDYYQLPQEDKKKLLEEQIAEAEAEEAAEDEAFEREQAAREARRGQRGERNDSDDDAAEDDLEVMEVHTPTPGEHLAVMDETTETLSIEGGNATASESAADALAAVPSFTPPQNLPLDSFAYEVHSDTISDGMSHAADDSEQSSTLEQHADHLLNGDSNSSFNPEEASSETPDGQNEEGDEGRGRRGNSSGVRGIHRRYRIQEVIKRNQIVLVQVIKEERGNKGCSLTTFISLAGRSAVLMPNSPKGGGISRKITDRETRRRLKEIASEMRTHRGMSVIIRTAGLDRTKAEIRRDYEYLVQLWNDVRQQTLASTAPALIYEEGNLIKRSLRDLYTADIEEVIVEGETAYEESKSFMRMLMPSHTGRVKLFKEATPLFAYAGIEEQLSSMTEPQAKLPSGGYIVINPTEALISIDVNSGRSTTERNVEETALKTNLEAATEVARQLRLRDLAGLIVIDFIDMNYGKNRKAVERAMKDALKHDRAKIQLGRISMFGLMELSRQRMRPSIAESMGIICPHCRGTGYVHSVETVGIQIIRTLEKEAASGEFAVLRITTHPDAALHLLNEKRDMLQSIEQRYNVSVVILIDAAMVTGNYRLIKVTSEGKEFAHEDGKQPRRSAANSRSRRGKRGSAPTGRGDRGNPLNFSDVVEENGEEYLPDESLSDDDNEIIGSSASLASDDDDSGERSERPRRERGERSDRPRRERGGRNRNRERGERRPRTANPANASGEIVEGAENALVAEGAEGDRNNSRRRGRRGGRNRNRERGERRPREGQVEGQITSDAGEPAVAHEQTSHTPTFVPRNTETSAVTSFAPTPKPSFVIPLEAQTNPSAVASPIVSESGESKEKRKGWWSRVLES